MKSSKKAKKALYAGFQDFLKKNRFETIVFILIAILMIPNFWNIYMWHDEAETAILGKNTMQYGVPKVYDGKNLFTNFGKEVDYNSEGIWDYSSWLHFYVAAFSFMLFGISTFSARLPFVLIGVLSFIPFVILFRRISINSMHYRLSVLALLLFVPYYLYSRQSRYFSLLMLSISLLLIATHKICSEKRIAWRDAALFAVSSILIFHSNFLSFAVMIVSVSIFLFIHWIKNPKLRKELFRKGFFAYLLIFVFAFPFALYADAFGRAQSRGTLDDFVIRKIDFIFHSINSNMPLILLMAACLAAAFYYFRKEGSEVKGKVYFSLFFSIVPIALLLFPRYSDARYITGMFPVWISFALLTAVFLLKSKKTAMKAAGIAVLALFLLTNFFYAASFYPFILGSGIIEDKCHTLMPQKGEFCGKWIDENFARQAKISFPFFYYLYEITHDYDGPTEGISKYLLENGTPDSVVFANLKYTAELQFYTGMKVLGEFEYKETEIVPDFIVIDSPDRLDIGRVAYLVNYAESRDYRKVELPYPDIPWENRPVLYYHKFWTQPVIVPAVVYVRE